MAPLFSIVTPVYEPPIDVLQATIDSVRAQTFTDWQLVLVDDRSPSEAVRETLRAAAAADPRITVLERQENGHIVAASNDAIGAATGEFIALLDHDDLLTDNALERVARIIGLFDDVDYIYTDEDKVNAKGRFFGVFHKPVWSPERLRGQMYCGHLSVIRTELVRRIGGFREGYDGSQDHDLILRVGEVARRVVHIPEILYHWRVVEGSAAGDPNAKPYAWVAGRAAVQNHLDRVGIDADVEFNVVQGTYRIDRRLDPAVRVSVVIPTNGKTALIWGELRCFVVEAVRSALAATKHDNLEFVVVYDASTPATALADLVEIAGDKLVLVPYLDEWNFSRKINLGVLESTGDRIVLLNDDVHVRSEGWLEELVAPLGESDVGMTGAKLFFSDGTIQHAGHRYCEGQHHHVFASFAGNDVGPYGALVINRECSGVTAACAALRRDVFDEVGGLSEVFPINFNDVDLSNKIRTLGYRVVWIANSELFHFESKTRVRGVEPWEHMAIYRRWGTPVHDEYLPAL